MADPLIRGKSIGVYHYIPTPGPDYWTNCSVVGIPVIRTKYREIRLELASFGANSRYETLASLGSTTLQHPTSSRCGHTGTETMGPLTLDITWLIGSLHDCLLRTDGRFYCSRAIWSSISVCLIPHTAFRSNSAVGDHLVDRLFMMNIYSSINLFKTKLCKLYIPVYGTSWILQTIRI